MVKDAKGNDFVLGQVYEDKDDAYKVIEITPAGHVIVDWFWEPKVVTEAMADDLYPLGEYPERYVDWMHFVENRFMQDRRNLFELHFNSGTWDFYHYFEAIGSGDLLVEKHISGAEYHEITLEINEYFKNTFKDFIQVNPTNPERG